MATRFPFETGAIRLTSPYGPRVLEGTSGFHGGIDIVGLATWNVVSVVSGTVLESNVITDTTDGRWMWGEHIIIAGDDDKTYFYFHLSSRFVNINDRVNSGQLIGIMGNTGYSFGAHLHFEVREQDAITRINAADVLNIPNEEGVYEPVVITDGDNCSDWAREYTNWAKDMGLFISDGDGNYRWFDSISRQELCVVLNRFYNLLR